MKSLASLSTTTKVGVASVLGSSGITGTGILIHNQLKDSYVLSGVDEELAKDDNSYLEIKTNSKKFTISTTEGQKNEASLEVKAKSDTNGNTFKTEDKWICTIKGIAKDSSGANAELKSTNSENFNLDTQTKKFSDRFGTGKKKDKWGFVKSCARNSSGSRTTGNLTSTIVVNLIPKTNGNTTQYEFSDEDVKKIFGGIWENPKLTATGQ